MRETTCTPIQVDANQAERACTFQSQSANFMRVTFDLIIDAGIVACTRSLTTGQIKLLD